MHEWWSDSHCRSKLCEVDFDEFTQLVMNAPPHRRIDEVILHHTWSPRAKQYRGKRSWESIQRYHTSPKPRGRGWSDIGYHIGIAPDETIWLLRPVVRSGGHCRYHNDHSVGVVMLGCYDKGADDPSRILPITASVIAVVCQRYSIVSSDVNFHRNFSSKTCPGSAVDQIVVRGQVSLAKSGDPKPKIEPYPWAEDAWERGIKAGLVDGSRPHDPLTREESCVMLCRLGLMPK